MPTHEAGGASAATYQSQDAAFFLANYRLGKTLGVGSFGKVPALSLFDRGSHKPPPLPQRPGSFPSIPPRCCSGAAPPSTKRRHSWCLERPGPHAELSCAAAGRSRWLSTF